MNSERLRNSRKKMHMSQKDLGDMLNVAQSTVASWENGAREPNTKTLRRMAEVFGVSADYLLGNDNNEFDYLETNADVVEFRVLGDIRAGYDGIAEEYPTGETTPVPSFYFQGRDPSEFFGLRIKGDSMYPTFVPGDRVLVRRGADVDSGAIAVVIYNGDEATVKRIRYDVSRRWLELVPINPEYMTRKITGRDLEQVMLLGKVVALFRTEF